MYRTLEEKSVIEEKKRCGIRTPPFMWFQKYTFEANFCIKWGMHLIGGRICQSRTIVCYQNCRVCRYGITINRRKNMSRICLLVYHMDARTLQYYVGFFST